MAIAPYIAFADDDQDDQDMLSERILKDHPGIRFRFFKDGQEIIRYLQSCPSSELPVLIILDYKMPVNGGADVLKALQEDSRYGGVRKVVWSTSGNMQYVNECTQYGAEKYFTKPNNMQELDIIVNKIYNILDSVQTRQLS